MESNDETPPWTMSLIKTSRKRPLPKSSTVELKNRWKLLERVDEEDGDNSSINILTKMGPKKELNPAIGFEEKDGWTEVRGVMDSGAAWLESQCVQVVKIALPSDQNKDKNMLQRLASQSQIV